MSGKESDGQRLNRLRDLVAHHQELYHKHDAPEISDEAYDALVRELVALEGGASKVAMSVGAEVSDAFAKVKHQVRQWSFDNVFNKDELIAWENKLYRYLEKKGMKNMTVTYVAEHKIDGLKIVLEYRGGQFIKAATRGDGVVGEDVTHTALTIATLPKKLSQPVDLLCVGEVWLPKSEFERINSERSKNGEPLFANPRNAAAGSLRQLDPAISKERGLALFAYDIDSFAPGATSLKEPQSQWEELALLTKLGLPVNQYAKVCSNLTAIETFYEEWKEKRDDLPYGVDGVVIKANEITVQKVAGHTAKAPRFGVAYKFPAVETTTIVEDIQLQVGRTGVVTPVAHLRPVLIDGSTVARATLHNEDQIKRLDVRIGDTIILRKAGDVIPEIVSVLLPLRPKTAKVYHFPKKVAGCGGDGSIRRVEGAAAYRCVSFDSDFLHRQQLYYFVSKTALNIDGVGPKIIDALLDAKLINDAADLFNLTKDDFLSLPNFKEKSAQNAVRAIEKAKETTLARLLVGLSIDLVGEETAILLTKHFPSPGALLSATREELEAVHGIGTVVAAAIVDWQKDKEAQSLFSRLLQSVRLLEEEIVVTDHFFSNKAIIFTGTLESLSRTDAEALARRLGARIASSVSKKTDYVVVGKEPGSKALQAEALGVKILNEQEFLALVAE